jgi:hypothetical protein
MDALIEFIILETNAKLTTGVLTKHKQPGAYGKKNH